MSAPPRGRNCYFPDLDLMPRQPSEEWLATVRARVVELPLARKQRFMRDYQLPASDAETFKNDVPLDDYSEHLAKQSKNPKAVANWSSTTSARKWRRQTNNRTPRRGELCKPLTQ